MKAQTLIDLMEALPAGNIRLLHFSRSPDLKTVDPKFQGTAQAGEERGRGDYMKPRFSNWYVVSPRTIIEDAFNRHWAYAAGVNPKVLADGNEMEQKDAAREGYKGIFYDLEGDQQVRLFVPYPVVRLGYLEIPLNAKYPIFAPKVFRYIRDVTPEEVFP